MDIQEALRDLIVTQFNWHGNRAELTGDYRLIEKGVIDSLGMFKIITFLEDELGFEIPDDSLMVENFETLDAIASMVTRTGAA